MPAIRDHHPLPPETACGAQATVSRAELEGRDPEGVCRRNLNTPRSGDRGQQVPRRERAGGALATRRRESSLHAHPGPSGAAPSRRPAPRSTETRTSEELGCHRGDSSWTQSPCRHSQGPGSGCLCANKGATSHRLIRKSTTHPRGGAAPLNRNSADPKARRSAAGGKGSRLPSHPSH